MTKLVHLSIKGRVQGVGYRAFVEFEAELRGLEGWVRNRRDGSVEAVVRGDERAIDDLVEACRKGPPSSRVVSIEVSEAEAEALELRGEERFAVLGTV
jgi:acylphosphatase